MASRNWSNWNSWTATTPWQQWNSWSSSDRSRSDSIMCQGTGPDGNPYEFFCSASAGCCGNTCCQGRGGRFGMFQNLKNTFYNGGENKFEADIYVATFAVAGTVAVFLVLAALIFACSRCCSSPRYEDDVRDARINTVQNPNHQALTPIVEPKSR